MDRKCGALVVFGLIPHHQVHGGSPAYRLITGCWVMGSGNIWQGVGILDNDPVGGSSNVVPTTTNETGSK